MKRKTDYWEDGIKEKRRKQVSAVQAERSASLNASPQTQIDMENMSPADLKNRSAMRTCVGFQLNNR